MYVGMAVVRAAVDYNGCSTGARGVAMDTANAHPNSHLVKQ